MSLVGKKIKNALFKNWVAITEDDGNTLVTETNMTFPYVYDKERNILRSVISGLEYEILDDGKSRFEIVKEIVDGVAPNTEIIENENGGKQSKTSYDFTTQIDPLTWLEMAKISQQGLDRYGADNISKISVNDNLNHAIIHIFAHLSGDKQDEHLAHACFRLLMAHSKSLWDAKKEE